MTHFRNPVFTINNPTEDDRKLLATLPTTYVVIGEEIAPTTGTPHLQCYAELSKQMRMNKLKEYIPRAGNIQERKGTPLQASDYCKEDGKYAESGTLSKDKRTNKRKRGAPEPMEPYCEDIILRPWQTKLVTLLKEKPGRTINWYFSPAGNMGKTTFAKYLVKHHDAIILGGKAADCRNGVVTYITSTRQYPKLVVINIPKSFNSEYLSYEALENIKDMLFYSGKYEGGQVCGPPCHLVVFANIPPNETKMSEDRWIIHEIQHPVTVTKT